MAITLTLLDPVISPAPTFPISSSESGMELQVEIKNPDMPGPDVIIDPGISILRAAGVTPRGHQARTPGMPLVLTYRVMSFADVAELLEFHRACRGPERPFYLEIPAEFLWPVPVFPGATLSGSVVLTPGSGRYVGEMVKLEDGEAVTFDGCRWAGEVAFTPIVDREDDTTGRQASYRVTLRLRVEMPGWET